MRRASAALVPLLLAIMLLFWFMGGESDNLHKVNQLENLQHTQERLIIAACQKKQELHDANASLSDTQLNEKVSQYIHNIMVLNNIDEN